MQFLKADTQVVVRVGPFVDVTDGFTPETGITLGAADEAELLKAGGGASVDISARTWAAVTGADGWYDLTLTTTDTNTEGDLTVVVQDDSVCLPVFAKFNVIAAGVHDMWFTNSGIVYGAAEAGTLSTTQMTSDLAEATDDHYNGRTIVWTSGVLLGQATDITDYTGATGLLTFTAVTEAPSATDTFVIV